MKIETKTAYLSKLEDCLSVDFEDGVKLGAKKSYSEDEILEIIRITKRDEHLTVNQIFQKVKKIQK